MRVAPRIFAVATSKKYGCRVSTIRPGRIMVDMENNMHKIRKDKKNMRCRKEIPRSERSNGDQLVDSFNCARH